MLYMQAIAVFYHSMVIAQKWIVPDCAVCIFALIALIIPFGTGSQIVIYRSRYDKEIDVDNSLFADPRSDGCRNACTVSIARSAVFANDRADARRFVGKTSP